jgi:UDP-N-acetylglucosamine acyltransferase
MQSSYSETSIHPSSIIHPKAQIGAGVYIGPYCVVGEHAVIGDGTYLQSHVVIDGWTTIGKDCKFHSHAVIGGEPQDLKFKGEESYVIIGNNSTFREFVTVNRGTDAGDQTIIGSNNLLMAYVHIAHNCVVGDNIVMANAATLAGHVSIENHAIIGGLSGIHQFVKVGAYAIIGGCSKVTQDVPPYIKADGHPVAPHGLNTLGLKRNGFSDETITHLKHAYKLLYRDNLSLEDALAGITKECGDSDEVKHFANFIRDSQLSAHHRGICR